MDFTSVLYFQNQGFEAYYFFLSIDHNCYRNNDDHTSDRENYLLIHSYQQREKTISIIKMKKKTNNLDKGVLGHMLPQTLFLCSCMHGGHNIKLYYISIIVIYI